MKKIIVSFLISFSVWGANASEDNQQVMTSEIVKLESDFHKLQLKVSTGLESNQQLLKEGSSILEKATVLVSEQSKKQDELILLLNEVKGFKESKTDLEFSIATDKPYVVSVILSILLSAFVTWMLLRKDATAGHRRLIKEFRQHWVNDFRDTVSSYVDKVTQIQAFQQNNVNFKITRNILIEIRNEYEEKKKIIDSKDIPLIDRVKEKLVVSRTFSKELNKEHDKEYQLKNSEYLALLSSTKVLSSKLHLLLKPTFEVTDEKDESVYNALVQIENYLNDPNTRYKIMNHDVLGHYNNTLLTATRQLLKSEWERIKDSKKV